jgi:UDP-N-acetylglucosamine acyltransferase
MSIHATAVVEDGVVLGNDVSVGPFSYIESGAVIGDGCRIGPHVTIYRWTTLGDECEVHAGAVLGDTPQDYGFGGGESFVKIGDRCIIREGVTVHRGTSEGSSTVIGSGCMFMAFSHFAHNVEVGDNVIVANGTLLGGYVSIGERAFVSGNVSIHQFTKIGRLAMLGGNSVATKDVPPFCTTHTAMENRVGGINIVGMRRAGFSREQLSEVKEAFKIIYRSGLNVSQAKEALKLRFSDGPGSEFADFIEKSERGICRSVWHDR